jgi:hypothetical protein
MYKIRKVWASVNYKIQKEKNNPWLGQNYTAGDKRRIRNRGLVKNF